MRETPDLDVRVVARLLRSVGEEAGGDAFFEEAASLLERVIGNPETSSSEILISELRRALQN